MERRVAWDTWNERTRRDALAFAEDYKGFITRCKTERLAVAHCVDLARKAGFRDLAETPRLKPGARVYRVNKCKQIVLAVVGERPLAEGARFIVAHIDAPRLDLKANPLYQDEGLALLKTCYYGGIKKYQWLSLPLALYGTAVLKDGSKREIAVGDAPGDPVFAITDLLPHLAKDQYRKTIEEGFPGESLNILAGSTPAKGRGDAKDAVRRAVLSTLKDLFGIGEEDLVSADLHAVPAGPARDMGLDRSMILGYGHDDRVCAYAAFRALLEAGTPPRTSVCILADQEEIGSRGSTSAQSAFVRFFMEETAEKCGAGPAVLRAACDRSRAISADVDSVLDPNFKDVHDPLNAARLGRGVVLSKTSGARGKAGSTEATAEYLAWIRRAFDDAGVAWQTGEIGKVEQGGGGTVATYFALMNIDTLDCGTGVLSMHAPFEIVSKADVYSTMKAYAAFLAADRGEKA